MKEKLIRGGDPISVMVICQRTPIVSAANGVLYEPVKGEKMKGRGIQQSKHRLSNNFYKLRRGADLVLYFCLTVRSSYL